jgi:hypothetical protein
LVSAEQGLELNGASVAEMRGGGRKEIYCHVGVPKRSTCIGTFNFFLLSPHVCLHQEFCPIDINCESAFFNRNCVLYRKLCGWNH